MSAQTFSALIGALFGLICGLGAAGVAFWAARAQYKIARARLIADLTSSSEIEKARVRAYWKLWPILSAASTWHPRLIATNLPTLQKNLQSWYYEHSGGLFIKGSAEDRNSTKGALFKLRDLQSTDELEIWTACHRLRRCLRKDLKIFETDADEGKLIAEVEAKLKK